MLSPGAARVPFKHTCRIFLFAAVATSCAVPRGAHAKRNSNAIPSEKEGQEKKELHCRQLPLLCLLICLFTPLSLVISDSLMRVVVCTHRPTASYLPFRSTSPRATLRTAAHHAAPSPACGICLSRHALLRTAPTARSTRLGMVGASAATSAGSFPTAPSSTAAWMAFSTAFVSPTYRAHSLRIRAAAARRAYASHRASRLSRLAGLSPDAPPFTWTVYLLGHACDLLIHSAHTCLPPCLPEEEEEGGALDHHIRTTWGPTTDLQAASAWLPPSTVDCHTLAGSLPGLHSLHSDKHTSS